MPRPPKVQARKPARGKGKGSKFERQLSVRLSSWWTAQGRDDVFWRTAGSGARATTRAKVGKGTAGHEGDIGSTDAVGLPLTDRFFIEAKNYNNLHFTCLIYRRVRKGGGDFMSFWLTAETQAARTGKEPLLIARQSGWPVLVALHTAVVAALSLHAGHVPPAAAFVVPELRLSVFPLDTFLHTFTSGHIQSLPYPEPPPHKG